MALKILDVSLWTGLAWLRFLKIAGDIFSGCTTGGLSRNAQLRRVI
jgi:hypothetical protein